MILSKATLAWHAAAVLAGLWLQTGCGGAGHTALFSTDVYVAGYESNGTVSVAKYWKNGAAVSLSDGIHSAIGSGIAVSDGDIYVAGGAYNGKVDVATYWKNGAPIALTDGTHQAFAVGIAVSGRDVYVAGYERDPANYNLAVAKLWKNGVATVLTDGSGGAQANAVAVSGGDVHVAGWEYQTHEITPNHFLSTAHAVYWKNGVKTTLTGAANGGSAESITLSGPDVYVCGNEYEDDLGVAKIWKNGKATALTDGRTGALATGVVVQEGALHASGLVNTLAGQAVATVWKNSQSASLVQGPYQSVSNGLAVAPVGGIVYAVGTVYRPNGPAAVYWQGGQVHELSSGLYGAEAWGIAVVQSYHF